MTKIRSPWPRRAFPHGHSSRATAAQLQRLTCRSGADPQSDAALLGRFVRDRDEAAFSALVDRHFGLVRGVCRRVLGDVHVAEDAAQATFLLLARKASSLSRPETLSAWLYGVARRLALPLPPCRPPPTPAGEAAIAGGTDSRATLWKN